MKRSMKTLGATLLTAGVLGAGLVATAPAAGAATASGYNGACGSGFGEVNSMPVGKAGTVYLTYNSSTGENCVVTQRNSTGDPVHMVAYVRNTETNKDAYEEGDFTQYAGPVYVKARATCVEWGGVIDKVQTWNYGSNCGALTGKSSQKNWFAEKH